MPALIASFDCQNSVSKGFCSGRTCNSENESSKNSVLLIFFVFCVCATRSFANKDYECATFFCCMLLGNSSPQEYHLQHESRAPFSLFSTVQLKEETASNNFFFCFSYRIGIGGS